MNAMNLKLENNNNNNFDAIKLKQQKLKIVK